MRIRLAIALAFSLALPAAANETSYNDAALFPIMVRDKHGAINRNGEVVIAPEYDEAIVLREGLARVRKGPRVAYLDASGRRVIEPQEMTSELFSQGLVPAHGQGPDGKGGYGYLDRKGQWRIAPKFVEAKPFSGSRAVVGMQDEWGRIKYGYIDASGALVIPARFDKAFAFSRVARVEIEKRLRLIDSSGRDVTPADIDAFGEPSDGMMLARKGRLLGFLDDEGRVAIAPRFQSVQDFKGGRARFWENGKYGYIDKKGAIVIEPKFDSAADFSEGLAAVRLNDRYGFIDPNGRMVIETAFERVQGFSDGAAAAQREKLWGFIGRDGKWKIEPRYAWVRPFRNGLAWAGEPRMRGGNYVDQSGKVIWKSPP
ncbi:MAG TPA: WG repeat-containing protein, partial [Burkholderiales bacterium]|nr:WG repeat-containing protein [Burkholderiales bacterium]